MTKNEFYYLSKDNKTRIHAIEWIPSCEVIAVLQICHGMMEYIDRYDEFAKYMAEHGVYVVGHDHLGHGLSVTEKNRLGFFDEKNGNKCVVGDIHSLRMRTQKKYANVPYFMMGHSMGSFLVRQYAGIHGEGLAGAIIMGTGYQPDFMLIGGKIVCRLIAVFKGWKHKSNFVNQLSVGGFDKKFGVMGWLTKNPDNVEKYDKDTLCGVMFSLNAFYNMFDGMLCMNKGERTGKIPTMLPVFFVSGEEDPVGDYGKLVKQIHKKYQNRGFQDVEMKLYPEDRHEIIKEDDREVVFEDIYNWIKRHM